MTVLIVMNYMKTNILCRFEGVQNSFKGWQNRRAFKGLKLPFITMYQMKKNQTVLMGQSIYVLDTSCRYVNNIVLFSTRFTTVTDRHTDRTDRQICRSI